MKNRRSIRAAMRCALVAVIASAAMALGTRSASAQGTQGLVAEPISTTELMRYAERLHLSNQQKLALEPLHDAYLEQYRSLRERDIQELMDSMMAMQGGMPSRDQFDKFMKNLEQINQRIVNVDNNLFTQMQSMLSQEQMADVRRVQMARERQRYLGSPIMNMVLMGSTPVDLAELADDLDLSPDQSASVDATLGQYETQLTGQMRKLYQTMPDVFGGFFDAMEAQGFAGADEDDIDPEQMQKMQQQMMEIMQRVMAEAMKRGDELRALNARTHRVVEAALPPEQSRSFRDRYLGAIEPGVGWQVRSHGAYFAAAAKVGELSGQQQSELSELAAAYHRETDPIIDEFIREVESRESMMPWGGGWDQDAWQKRQEETQQFTKKLQDIRNRLEPRLRELVGDRMAKIEKVAQLMVSDQNASVEAAAEQAEQAAIEAHKAAEAPAPAALDYFLPQRIAQRDIEQYEALLQLADELKPVLRGLHADYLNRVAEIEAREIKALQESVQTQWAYDPQTGVSTPPTKEKIEKAYRLRGDAAAALRRAEGEFFDAMALTLVEPDDEAAQKRMQRVRWRRDRQWATPGGNLGWTQRSAEAGVDVVQLIQQLRLDDKTLASIDDICFEYERDAAAAQSSVYELTLLVQKNNEIWGAEWQRLFAEDPQAAQNYQRNYREIFGDSQTKLAEASNAASAVNLTTMKRLEERFEPETWRQFQRAYNVHAFPDIYNDPRAPLAALDRAASLEDLSSQQRQSLNELSISFRPAYDALCDQLADLRREYQQPNWAAMADQDEIRNWQEQQAKQERVEFDRTELIARAVSRMRIILSEEQIRRLGGMPKLDDNQGHGMGW